MLLKLVRQYSYFGFIEICRFLTEISLSNEISVI